MTGAIRPVRLEDGAALAALVREFAAWEHLHVPGEEETTRLLHDALDAPRPIDIWVVEADGGGLVGFAILYDRYSSFRARRVLHLEDFYLQPAVRGAGLGARLFRAVIEEAERRGACRLEWEVLDWNVHAQEFYYRFGGERVRDAFVFQLPEAKFAQALKR